MRERESPRPHASAAALDRLRPVFAGLSLLFVGVTGVLTLMPLETVPAAPGGDKLHHLVAFGAIALTGVLGLPRAWEHRWIWVMVAVSLYGGAIELIQPYVGRFGEWGDWVADAAGAILGAAAARVLVSLTRRPLP